MSFRYFGKNQARGVTHMGHVSVAAVMGGEAGLEGGIVHAWTAFGASAWSAAQDQRNEAAPVYEWQMTGRPVSFDWGLIENRLPDGTSGWGRSFESAGQTGDVQIVGGDGEGNNILVGGNAALTAGDIAIKDEAGTTLATITAPVGKTVQYFFWAALLDKDTGSVTWARACDWTGDPGSTLGRAAIATATIKDSVIHLEGYYRTSNINAGGANQHVPTWFGVQVPAVGISTAGAFFCSGNFLLTADINGDGVECVGLDNPGFYPNQGQQSRVLLDRQISWGHVVKEGKVYASANWMGDAGQNGGLAVGRGHPSNFLTREFSDSTSSDRVQPCLARLDASTLEPEVAVTVRKEVWPQASSTAALAFRPLVLENGDIIWAHKSDNNIPPGGYSIDRSGGAGSYGGAVVPTSGNAYEVVIHRIPADFGAPVWSQVLSTPTAGGNDWAFSLKLFETADNILVSLSHDETSTPTLSIMGQPATTWNRYEGRLVTLAKDTGAFVSMAKTDALGLGGVFDGEFYTSGPTQDNLVVGTAFQVSGDLGQGLYDTAGVRQLNPTLFWPQVDLSKTGIYAARYTDAGEIDAAASYPLLGIDYAFFGFFYGY